MSSSSIFISPSVSKTSNTIDKQISQMQEPVSTVRLYTTPTPCFIKNQRPTVLLTTNPFPI